MSKITLAPNASGTGTLTVAAPNTNTDRTLTLPDVTTTLVGTDATQTLTNKSIAASQLTGALPAIDGSALTGIVTGSLTLLGTLATTSGTSVTLSGLTLTSYKQLLAIFNNVSSTANFVIRLSGVSITTTIVDTNSFYGFFKTDLATGVFENNLVGNSVTSGSTMNAGASFPYAGIQNVITTASTSVTFTTTAGTFDAGSIVFYGVK